MQDVVLQIASDIHALLIYYCVKYFTNSKPLSRHLAFKIKN